MSATLRPGGTNFTFMPIVPQQGPGALIKFRALITNISDDSSPSWSENMDIGRADPKMLYTQYSRTVSVDFKTAALYNGEHTKWIEALNSLKEMTKPVYKPGKGFNGVFTKMKIGKLIDVVGVMTSVTFSIDSDTPWRDDIPMYVNASVNLKAMDNKKPDYKKGDAPFKSFGYGTGL